MLRVLFNQEGVAPWLLSEDDLLVRIDGLAATGFSGAPQGPVAVEGLDERERIKWRGHYPSVASLVTLAAEIREGRSAALRRSSTY